MIDSEPISSSRDRAFSARDLVVALHRENARQHLSNVQQLAVACEAALSSIPMNTAALAALSNGLDVSHDAFRAAALSMAHALSSDGIA